MRIEYFLIGAGGHGRVVYDAWMAHEEHQLLVWDDDVLKNNSVFLDTRVKAPVDLSAMPERGHVAIGNNEMRCKLSLEILNAGKELVSVFHPKSIVSSFSEVQSGCFIAAAAVIAPDAVLSRGVIVNHGSVVDHNCQIGEYSHIAPNATLGGDVKIGKNCLIGSSAVILPGVKVADGVTVGSGAVVNSDINKENVVVCGIPAKIQTG
jgi:sugar O-acyltransferase (sialic acid O-acetyltransferase NeuD family)